MNTVKSQTAVNHALSSQRLGIFGGTFDPIHHGHIAPIKQAAKQLNLSQINIMPSAIPPHKSHTHTETEHRINMVKLVCEQEPLFHLDLTELKRQTPSYTAETLSQIKASNTFKHHNIYFFIGMDSLLNFTSWYRWQDILTLANLVVLPRPGYDCSEIPQTLFSSCHFIDVQSHDNITLTSSANGNIFILPPVLHDISSTQIRATIRAQKAITSLVPLSVANYIEAHQLYR